MHDIRFARLTERFGAPVAVARVRQDRTTRTRRKFAWDRAPKADRSQTLVQENDRAFYGIARNERGFQSMAVDCDLGPLHVLRSGQVLHEKRTERNGNPEDEAKGQRSRAGTDEPRELRLEADCCKRHADEERRTKGDAAMPGRGDRTERVDERR